MKNYIDVKNEEIIQLIYGARGFKHAFYVIYKSFFNNGNTDEDAISHLKWQDTDPMSVMGTIGLLAVELYFKFFAVIETYISNTNNKVTKCEGKHLITHDLEELYLELQNTSPTFIKDLEQEFRKRQKTTLFTLVSNCKKQFIQWRYAYSEKNAISIHLNQLSSCLNLLEKKASEKFWDIQDDLSKVIHNGASSNKTMVINIFEDIEEEECW